VFPEEPELLQEGVLLQARAVPRVLGVARELDNDVFVFRAALWDSRAERHLPHAAVEVVRHLDAVLVLAPEPDVERRRVGDDRQDDEEVGRRECAHHLAGLSLALDHTHPDRATRTAAIGRERRVRRCAGRRGCRVL
jgi:hypothetical protein